MNKTELASELRSQVSGQVLTDAMMRDYTTWRTGGPADLLCLPASEEDILTTLNYATRHALPVTVIGNCSNLLVLDGGIRGLTMRICGTLNGTLVEDDSITAGAGILLPALARVALRNNLSGLEFAAGIPAALGGAVVMNVGAVGQQLGSLITAVATVDLQGRREIWKQEQLAFGYRTSALQGREYIILQAILRLIPAGHESIAELMERNLDARKRTQPLDLPSAGSVFRNPPGYSAAKLIEMAGLKGTSVGDAEISTKHANFIVNHGHATAQQLLTLIRIAQKKVADQFDVYLVTEVRLVGEER